MLIKKTHIKCYVMQMYLKYFHGNVFNANIKEKGRFSELINYKIKRLNSKELEEK